MSGYRVYMKHDGWRVGDGSEEHGPYPTYDQARLTADNLNLQRAPDEVRSFAPASGDRRDARPMPDGKVMHGVHPDHPMPPHMVSETRGGEPDAPIGDLVEYEDGPDVWEAVEEPLAAQPDDEERAAREAIERARVPSTDSPAAGPLNFGGGAV